MDHNKDIVHIEDKKKDTTISFDNTQEDTLTNQYNNSSYTFYYDSI